MRENERSFVPSDFSDVYRENFQYVFHVIRRLGVRERDLEDVAHDVFLAVYRHLASYDSSRPLRPWLFGFAYRAALDHKRLSRHRYENEMSEDEPIDTKDLPDQQLGEEQVRRQVLRALDKMDFERRGILVMHDLDGHSMPEIAQALAIPLNTAYSRLRLARQDFESAFQRTKTRYERGLKS